MNDALIKKLIDDVEIQLNWEDSSMWTTNDFEELSERIFKKTSINLSVTTLKRLWGKISYDSKPTITTLNTLAQFISFNNWREYKQKSGFVKKDSMHPKVNNTLSKVSPKKRTISIIGITLLVCLLFFFFFNKSYKDKPEMDASLYSFDSKKVASVGVPNSVIFSYDANAAGVDDIVEIQQSWDERLRVEVPKDRKIHNSIYYYPGYFKAKFLVSDSLMKEEGILIKTNGWLPLIEKDVTKPPLYFKKDDLFEKDSIMTLPIEKIKEANIELMPEPIWTTFYNINDFGGTSLSNNFLFETEVKNDYTEVAGLCQYIDIILYFEGVMFYIPMSYKGCVSNLSLYDTDGTMDVDISALGFDPGQWMKLRVEVINEVGKIYINDKFEYDFSFHFDKPEKFVGIKYNFQGTGSVKYTRFINGDSEAVFNENY